MNHERHGRRGRPTNVEGCGRERSLSGFGRTGGRRGRIFDSGELQLVILALISEENRHGYELIREIEARSGGIYAPSPGMVYPTLSLLLEMGLIEEVETDGARKNFAITEAGRSHVADNSQVLDQAFSRLRSLAEAKDRADPAPLRRAVGNLRQVLLAAAAKPDFTDEQVLEAARMIDNLAGEIERM